MPEKVIANAKLVLPDEVLPGVLEIGGGMITGIGTGSTRNPSFDFEGDYVIPGMIELHTDNLERHIMPRPKSFWPTAPALLNHDREIAACGITTVFDALSVGYEGSDVRSGERLTEIADSIEVMSRRGALKAEHFIHWRCEVSGRTLMRDLLPLLEGPRTAMISVMDHTPGQRQFVSLDVYRTYYQGKFGYTDEEMRDFMAARRRDHEEFSHTNRRRVVEEARNRGLAVASHDDATVQHVEEAVRDGVSVAEFPTTIEAARASHESGLGVLMGAPNLVRGGSHSGNASARDLADLGCLDILSSDYVPASLLYGAMKLAESDEMDIPQAIARVSRNPARQVRLADRGELAIGKRADLVRFRMEGELPIIVEVWRGGFRIA